MIRRPLYHVPTMETCLFKDTGAAEGACGKIISTDDAKVVIKRIHRHLKHRAKCLDAKRQCEIQQWASALLTPANGFSTLYAPMAWAADERQYFMQRVDCTEQLDPTDMRVRADLMRFYERAREVGIFPCDYELYLQPDSRVALIDVDKFATWQDTSVKFPWGLVWTYPKYPWTT
jgi:hypothetical protein